MAVTGTRKNSLSALSAAVAYVPTALDPKVDYTPTMTAAAGTIDEKESDCKTKFHIINTAAAALGADATALSATITPLNADIAKITTNLTAIDNGLAPLETNVTTAGNNFTTVAAERVVTETSSLTATDTLANGLTAKYAIVEVVVKCTTATTGNASITLDVESAGGSKDFVNGGTVTGTLNSISRLTVIRHAVSESAGNIVFTSADWKAGAFTAWVILEKVIYT